MPDDFDSKKTETSIEPTMLPVLTPNTTFISTSLSEHLTTKRALQFPDSQSSSFGGYDNSNNKEIKHYSLY